MSPRTGGSVASGDELMPRTRTSDRHRRTIARTGVGCHICGEPIDYTLPYLDPGEFVVDHVTPLAKGGKDVLANKAAAHRSCNRSKSDKDHAPIVRRSRSLA